ncbi:MAG: hypothetical protein ACRETX_02530, partial [Steroidobacteraceae bacterium]
MRIARITILGLLAIAAGGCHTPPPRSILTQCVTVDGTQPATVPIPAPAAGTMRIAVEPRGIAVVASIQTASGVPAPATSPVDRLGLIALVVPVRAGDTIALRIESRDSREIRADVCVGAELLHRSDVARTRAERAFAAAGHATHGRDWRRAFDDYEEAARSFEQIGLDRLAGAARHAMGELAYMRLHRERDALKLVTEAREAHGADANAAIRGTLAALGARATVEVADVTVPAERKAAQGLIDDARRLLGTSPAGTREALRLTVLEGFLAYRANAPDRAERFFVRAMQDCRATKDWECHGTAAQNVALLAEARESFAVALQTYEEARRYLDADVAPEQAADILDNMGRLQRVAGLVSASDASHASALHLYARLRDCDSVRRTLARLGVLHAQVGSFDDALVELERAASFSCSELFESLRLGDNFAVRTSRSSAPACTRLLEPAALSADGRLAVLQAVLALNDASLLVGDVDGAQRCLAQAHRYAGTSRGQVRIANARGELLLERTESAAARSAFEEARKIADEAKLPPTYEHRGRTMLGLTQAALLAGDAREAHRLGLKALFGSSERADAKQAIEALRLLAAALRVAGRPELASRTLRAAAELIESVPIGELDGEVRATYLAAQHSAFAELTELLAASARDEASTWTAFAAAERGRARSYRYALNQAGVRDASADEGNAAVGHEELLRRVSEASAAAEGDEPFTFARRLAELGFGSSAVSDVVDPRVLRQVLARLDAVLV